LDWIYRIDKKRSDYDFIDATWSGASLAKGDAVGKLEGSRFYPAAVCTHILEPRVYQVGVCEQAAPANFC
jgi:hypothetical protein